MEISSRGRRAAYIALAIVQVTVLGLADWLTGVEISFSIFYLIPVSVAAWFTGRSMGLIMSLLSAATWFANDALIGGHAYSHPLIPVWNAFMRFGVFSIVTVILSRLGVALESERRAHQELDLSYAALDELRKQQLLLKDQILSNVSHELRTPLTAVHQFVTILLDGLAGELEPEQREYLEIALKNVDQLSRMIQDLLDATRADAGKLTLQPRPMELCEVVAEVMRTLRSRAAESGISLEAELPADLPAVHADPARVRQVLINLVDNAIKFTQPGGRACVSASLAQPGFVCVAVSDTGRGMAPQVQSKLFQRLYQENASSTSSRQGLGLGLYISRELVSRQGGRMWVESQPGRGSTFFFTLPIAEAFETPGGRKPE